MIHPVSASAGSGKTYYLTRRFLALLQGSCMQPYLPSCLLQREGQAYSLSEILAATFTNKAAAEMKNRVVLALKEQALRDTSGPHSATAGHSAPDAGRRLEQILRHYTSLNIRTIDSLLTMLVRLSAMELELPPNFIPSFDPEEYFTPLYDALMEDIKSGDDALFAHTSAQELAADLEEACRTLLYGDVHGFSARNRLRDQIFDLTQMLLTGKSVPQADTHSIHAALHFLHAGVIDAGSRLRDCLHAEKLKGSAHFMTFLANCLDSTPYRPAPKSAYAEKSCLDECLLKASKGKAGPEAEAAYADLTTGLELFSREMPAYRAALQLAPLVRLAHEMHARILSMQKEHGVVPVPSLPLLAGRILSGETGVSDALCRMGSRLAHLLLDEFQDTSREQWAALLPLAVESLSTGGSLTYVGDIKQAIYGWRGGDARLFAELASEPELRAIAPDAIGETLPCNWRSHPAVVTFNNAFFSLLADERIAASVLKAMLPERTPERYCLDAALQATAVFAGCAQALPEDKDWSCDPHAEHAEVCLYVVSGKKTEDVAVMVEQRLRTLLCDDLLHHWRPGDIAVLVRSSSEGRRIAEALSNWGLPVVTEDSFLLDTHPLVRALIALMAFLDYPPDDAAFITCVSSAELFGGTGCPHGPALTDWLAECEREHGENRPPLYRLFRKDFPDVWQRTLAPFLLEAGVMSAYDILVEATNGFALAARLPGQTAFLQRLLEVAHAVENSGHSSPAAFLAYWRRHGAAEKLPLPEGMDAIRIMTMHKAKGLEFPVVILPFQHTAERGRPQPVAQVLNGVEMMTRDGEFLPDRFYPARITEELERLNLLYVAWTRPVYALHAFITRPSRSTPLSKGLAVLLEAFDRHADALCRMETIGGEDDTTDMETFPSPQEEASSSAAETPAPQAGMEPEDTVAPVSTAQNHAAHPWKPMSWLPRLKIYRSNPDDAQLGPRQRGILAHLCLEHLHISEPRTAETLERDVAHAVRQAMRLSPLPAGVSTLAGSGSAATVTAQLATDMTACLLWFASLPHAPLWLAHGRREQGILDASGRMRRVDLLVAPDEHGGLLAIDYKTGHSPDPQIQEHYHVQVRRYMSLVRAATGSPVRGLLVYLDEQRLDPVDTLQGQQQSMALLR